MLYLKCLGFLDIQETKFETSSEDLLSWLGIYVFPLSFHLNARIVTFDPSTTLKIEVNVFSKTLGTGPLDWQQLIIDIDPVLGLCSMVVGDVANISEIHDLNPEDGRSMYLWNIRNVHTV
jgi:hypothetical protein